MRSAGVLFKALLGAIFKEQIPVDIGLEDVDLEDTSLGDDRYLRKFTRRRTR